MREWLQRILTAYERNDMQLLGELLDQAQSEAGPSYWAASGMIMRRDGQLQNGMEAFLLALHADAGSAPVLLAEVQALIAQYLSTQPTAAQPQTRLSRPRTSPHLEGQPDWQQLAYAYALAGRGEEAFALIQEQVERQPDDPEASIFMAKIFGSRGLFKEARSALALALSLAPYHSEALLVRGMLLQEMERYDEALADYLSVVLLESANALAWEGQAEVILLAGWDPQAALSAFEQALALDPKRARCRRGRARALHALGREVEQEPAEERSDEYPDVILEAWYRHEPDHRDRRCYMCGKEATFATEHYLDIEYVMGLALRKPDTMPEGDLVAVARRLHEAAKARAVAEQESGIRKRYATTWWCQECMVDLINGQMGHTGPGETFLLHCTVAETQGEHGSAVLFRYRTELSLNQLLYTRETSLEGFLHSLADQPDVVIDYTQPPSGIKGTAARPYARRRKKKRRRRH